MFQSERSIFREKTESRLGRLLYDVVVSVSVAAVLSVLSSFAGKLLGFWPSVWDGFKAFFGYAGHLFGDVGHLLAYGVQIPMGLLLVLCLPVAVFLWRKNIFWGRFAPVAPLDFEAVNAPQARPPLTGIEENIVALLAKNKNISMLQNEIGRRLRIAPIHANSAINGLLRRKFLEVTGARNQSLLYCLSPLAKKYASAKGYDRR